MKHRPGARGTSGPRVSVITIALILLAAGNGHAFPSWMGVYGSHVRHNGQNPGTFSVLMNQDYWGLHAEVGIRVNGGSWSTYEMTYVGNVDGNSKYQFTPWWEFPATQIVEFYFHGWDNWGGNLWDSNHGQNYWFPAYHNGRVQWVGSVWNWPTNGAIASNDNFLVNIESWPAGAGKGGRVVYTVDRGLTWVSTPMSFNGQSGNNDQWRVNLGKFRAAETIRYAIEIEDWDGAFHWDNNGGFDFHASVSSNPAEDEDGDGMPNGWEAAHGFDPTDATDAGADKDEDELTNLQEYQAGSDPAVADTDGDGLSDALEVQGTQTSPTNAQSSSIQVAVSVAGGSASNVSGNWLVQGDELFAATNRGSVEYSVNVPARDVYLLEIKGANTPFLEGFSRPAEMDVYVDDMFIKRLALAATASNSAAQCVTPLLLPGAHTVRIFWDNDREYHRLLLSRISLHSLAGSDSNGDGTKDWVENWLVSRNGAELLPPSSAVSPAFIEGRSAFWDLMEISSGLTLAHGAGKRWYANVPLTPGDATQVTLSYENGSVEESGQIQWRPTNVLLDDGMTLRVDDALLLTAYPLGAVGGSVVVAVQGQSSFTTSVESPVPVQFADAGIYTVTGTYDDGVAVESRSITVAVVSATFSDSPAAWIGKVRTWNCPGVGTNVAVQPDPSMRMSDSGVLPGGGRVINFVAGGSHPAHVVARLNEGGSIVDSVPVRGFRLFSSGQVYIKIVETYADGTELVEMGVVQSPVLSDTSCEMEIFAGGVTFDDGTLFSVLLSSDFDDLDQAVVRFLKAPGVQTSTCHDLKVFQGGDLVGERQ